MPGDTQPSHSHTASELPPPTLEQVSPGVYAYIQLDGTWGLNNTGFITGRDGVSMVDTCFTEARTQSFLQAVRAVTDLPIRTLVNTHHHGDHKHGNYLVPAASIIGHELCRKEVIETGVHALHPLFPNVSFGSLEVAAPFVTFRDRLDLFVDDLRIELHYMGPAHTTNDVVVWLPERRVLFTGDLVFNGGMPFIAMGSVEGSLRALDRLRDFDAETIVPGHGPVCGPGVFEDIEAYFRFLQDTAKLTFDSGLSPLEAAQQTDLGRFNAWHDKERIAGNLHRAYSELRGEPLGTPLALGPIVDDMVAYNGGNPVRCLA